MKRPNDYHLTSEQWISIRRAAEQALRGGGGFGRWPTPVSDIMTAAKVVLAPPEALTERFILGLRRRFTAGLKRAIEKVRGIYDAVARLIYVDASLLEVKQTFVKLHETGHAVIPHQKGVYAMVEDCRKTLEPDIADLFDREANVFASEVLFQLDGFITEARDSPFGLRVPLALGKRYGASCYAAIRQYVMKSDRACVVVVLDPPEVLDGTGIRANVRRVVPSPAFIQQFSNLTWPEYVSSGDEIGNMIPLGQRKMSRPQAISLRDNNGVLHECIAEAFCHKYNCFILIHSASTTVRTQVILPKKYRTM